MIYDALTGELLIEFDTYIENTYNNQNGIAFEPLENGSFSSDSKQNTPEIVNITGIKSINNTQSSTITVGQVRSKLIELNKFQEIRLTNTEYTQQQNVANPQDTPQANAGQVQPTKDESILSKFKNGKFGI